MIECELLGIDKTRVSGKIVTAQELNERNTFEAPDAVTETDFTRATITGNKLSTTIPSKSIVVLEVE